MKQRKTLKKGKGINLIKIMNSITHLSRSDIHLTQSNIAYKERRHDTRTHDQTFRPFEYVKLEYFFNH